MLASVLLFAASEPTVVVKLGGSAVTRKDKFETLNQRVLASTAQQLRATRGSAVLVHGCGSFGHFQAHEFGIAKGTTHPTFSWLGFAKTRKSATKLSALVLGALIDAGLPAVHCAPFPLWRKRAGAPTRASARAGVAQCRALLRAGLLPVLHGDSVLDDARGCAILSGDELLEELCGELRPKLAVLLTDVAGVFDKPPSESGAALIPEIRVRRNGALVIPSGGALTTSSRAHDVSGGLAAKLQSAAAIAARGTPVVIVQAGTPHAAEALAGRWPEVGTRVLRIRGGAIAPPAALPTALQRRWRAAFGCEFCGDTRAVVCPNCDGVGGYTAMGGVDVACKACRGTGRVVCRDCFTGDGYDIEGIRRRLGVPD